MDFIERWFHIAPDGGNGVFEMVYLVAAVAATAAAVSRRRLLRLIGRPAHPLESPPETTR